jgi:hypothetical protein
MCPVQTVTYLSGHSKTSKSLILLNWQSRGAPAAARQFTPLSRCGATQKGAAHVTSFTYLTRRSGGVYYLQIRLPESTAAARNYAAFHFSPGIIGAPAAPPWLT